MKMTHMIAASGLVLVVTLTSAHAQNLLVNGDFENQSGFTANPIGVSGINQGWATFNGGGSSGWSDMNNSIYYPHSGAGALLESLNPGNNWNPAGAYQIVSGVTPGSTYTFGIWALTDTVDTAPNGILVQLGFQNSSLGGVSTVENPGGSVNLNGNLPTLGVWTYYSVQATVPAGDSTAIVYAMFQDNNSAVATENMYFDDASLTTVPEPSSIALIGMALAGVPMYLRNRRQA